MTAVVTVTCDGHRHGQPCRGALPVHAHDTVEARFEVARARHGWRGYPGDVAARDLCPSRGHDEDAPT